MITEFFAVWGDSADASLAVVPSSVFRTAILKIYGKHQVESRLCNSGVVHGA